MIKHELNTLIFTISYQRDLLLHQTIKRHLINVGDIDVGLLMYLTLNQLTINQLVSATLTKSIEQLCREHFANYSYEQHTQIIAVCEQIAGIIYQDYQTALAGARIPLPARLVNATYSDCVISMSFECMDDQSCAWSYTTSPH